MARTVTAEVSEGWSTSCSVADRITSLWLVQWEFFGQGGLALSTDDEIAGKGLVFLVDVATERAEGCTT